MNYSSQPLVQESQAQVPALLMQAADAIMLNRKEDAIAILSGFEPADDISRVCAQALLGRKKEADHIYLTNLQDKNKQINVFDLVLRNVDTVRVNTAAAFHMMHNFYGEGQQSITHFNVGIGKGHFEVQLIKALAENAETLPALIKIIGLDIDEYSLREAGKNIADAANNYLPAHVRVEYTSVCAFAEEVSDDVWSEIKDHGTDSLGVISAFTLHHISSGKDRQQVLKNIANCKPGIFLQVEPDVNDYTPVLRDRLVNCWNVFGATYRLIDQRCSDKAEADALKYVFFKREVEDILSNDEEARFEKHEEVPSWAERCAEAGFNLVDISYKITEEIPGVAYKYGKGYVRMTFEGTPTVGLIVATTSL